MGRLHVLRWLLLALLATVVSAVVTDAFVRRWGFRGDSPRFGLVAMVDGTAWRPYVYRRLAAGGVDHASAALDAVLTDDLRHFLTESSPLRAHRQATSTGGHETLETWDARKALLFHVAYGVVFMCYGGTIFMARALLGRVGGPGMFADFAPLLGLLLLPITFVRGGFLYDAPELLLLTAYIWCLAAPRPGLLVCLFTLAVLNKESSLTLAVVAPVCLAGRVPRSQWWRLTVGQAAVGTAIVGALWYSYRNNPGVPVEWGLPENLAFWADPRSYLAATAPYGGLIPVPRASSVYVVALVAGLIAAGWAAAPPWARYGLMASLLLSVPLLVFFSWRDEIRVLSLAFPFVFLIGALGVRRLYEAGTAP